MANEYRISQVPVEVVISPTDQDARLSQLVVEVVIGPVQPITDIRVAMPQVVQAGGMRW